MPVSQMLSNSISFWLSNWLKDVSKVPKTVVCYQSAALLNALFLSFNKISLENYLNITFSSLTKKQPLTFQSFIRLDYNHFLNLISKWKCFKSCRKQLKDFFIRCINCLIESTKFGEFSKLLENILLVALSAYENEIICRAKNTLKSQISKLKTLEYEDEDENTDTDTDLETNQETANGGKYLSEAWFHDKENKIKKLVCKSGENENYHYFPEIIPHIRHIMKSITLWSGLLIPSLGYAKKTETSAQVESYFKDIKKVAFENYNLPINIDKFLILSYKDIHSKSILVSSRKRKEIGPIEYQTKVLDKYEEENWKNRNKKIKTGHYKHLKKFEKSIFLIENGSLINRPIGKAIFKNTCPIDSLVQGLACISADCEIVKQEADSGLYPNYLFQFINAVLNFENSGLVHEKRANFIIKLNMYKPDKILNVDQYSCESNICSIVDNLGLNFISVKEVCQCEMKTFNAPYLNVNINIVKSSLFQNIQEAVDNCF